MSQISQNLSATPWQKCVNKTLHSAPRLRFTLGVHANRSAHDSRHRRPADTVIADQFGNLSVHAAVYESAAPWLATTGSGDVLTGLICGILARGASAYQAAQTASWVHAASARCFGAGLIAGDIVEGVPEVLKTL